MYFRPPTDEEHLKIQNLLLKKFETKTIIHMGIVLIGLVGVLYSIFTKNFLSYIMIISIFLAIISFFFGYSYTKTAEQIKNKNYEVADGTIKNRYGSFASFLLPQADFGSLQSLCATKDEKMYPIKGREAFSFEIDGLSILPNCKFVLLKDYSWFKKENEEVKEEIPLPTTKGVFGGKK